MKGVQHTGYRGCDTDENSLQFRNYPEIWVHTIDPNPPIKIIHWLHVTSKE